MSHSACKPVRDSVLGQTLDDVADIDRIGDLVRANSLDLLQATHTLSGIDIAMWDLLGRRFATPVYQLLGYERAEPRLPYASVLFGDTPARDAGQGAGIRETGYVAAKFGWGPYGLGSVEDDTEQVAAAREGIGDEGSSSSTLAPSGGMTWPRPRRACRRCRQSAPPGWRSRSSPARWRPTPRWRSRADLCACRRRGLAQQGHGPPHDRPWRRRVHPDRRRRIGGISPAKRVADYALQRGVTYVNHTFTSHLALSASLQPYAGHPARAICEYPVELKPLAWDITHDTSPPMPTDLSICPKHRGWG